MHHWTLRWIKPVFKIYFVEETFENTKSQISKQNHFGMY